MSLLDFLNFYFIPGLVLGSIYALGAVGITLIFAILRYAHLAHGDLATLGAFLALAIVTGFGLTPLAALPLWLPSGSAWRRPTATFATHRRGRRRAGRTRLSRCLRATCWAPCRRLRCSPTVGARHAR